jgi:hypothetical protein
MRTTTHLDTVNQRPPTHRLDQLQRVLARRRRRGATIPSKQTGDPTARRVWREVAPGEWRWLQIPDQAELKPGRQNLAVRT